ncbi:MAG: M20/M25/M40 family metallo-hydrolase [Chthonomonadales bacterium]|nr:M20/M25/M40 family metallo-hydrolase [Chthonomonadales bacterium]
MQRPVPSEVADRILARCFGEPIAYRELRELCDHVGGRTSGAESGAQAEAWALRAFARCGIEQTLADPLTVPVWKRGSLTVEVQGVGAAPIAALAHGFAPEACDIAAPILDVGYGLPADYARLGDLARGAMALCSEAAPEGQRAPHRTEKLAWAVDHGVAGLMIMGSAPGCLPRTGVCHRSGSPIPSVGITREDGERLRRMLEDGLRPTGRIAMTNTITEGTAHNILADIPGCDEPSEIVLAGGHLDSWDVSQGATDNGLGCAIVLQAAHALCGVGRRPRRTIRFALWAAEETGLRGSRAYVAARRDELDSIVGVMNFDMTGDPYGYWTPGRPEPPEMLHGLARQLAPLGMREEFGHTAGLHSDHQPFMLAGVPVVCLSARGTEGGGGAYYHSVGDTFEKVSQPALCRAAAVAAHTLWALADCEQPPYRRMSDAEVTSMIEAAGLKDAIID